MTKCRELEKNIYMEKAAVDRMVPAEEEGQHVVEFSAKAVKEFMHSEDSYMHVSGQCSDRACKEYRKAIGLLVWTNGSTFYQCLHPLLVAHVKSYLWQTVFHPAKFFMQMDLEGGMLSMEALEVLCLCETDGPKYMWNTIICLAVDIKYCCKNFNILAKHIVPYQQGHLDDMNGGGEYIQWQASHMMAAMIQLYSISEVANE